jgi:hypothetical protein
MRDASSVKRLNQPDEWQFARRNQKKIRRNKSRRKQGRQEKIV